MINVAPIHNLELSSINKTSVEKLEWICKKLGLPQPVYKALDMRPKRGSVTYECTVKVSIPYLLINKQDEFLCFLTNDYLQRGFTIDIFLPEYFFCFNWNLNYKLMDWKLYLCKQNNITKGINSKPVPFDGFG